MDLKYHALLNKIASGSVWHGFDKSDQELKDWEINLDDYVVPAPRTGLGKISAFFAQPEDSSIMESKMRHDERAKTSPAYGKEFQKLTARERKDGTWDVILVGYRFRPEDNPEYTKILSKTSRDEARQLIEDFQTEEQLWLKSRKAETQAAVEKNNRYRSIFRS